MPEYLAPGVYTEEIEIGPKPIEGVSTSTAGFLGPTERGPVTPRLVTSFGQYQRVYGGYLESSYLTYGVDGFFRNGGQRCFIGRVVSASATAANFDLGGIILVEATGEGEWGNRVAIKVENGTLRPNQDTVSLKDDLFKLTIMYWREMPPTPVVDPTKPGNRNDENVRKTDAFEIYDNLSADPKSPDYYRARVNGVSDLVRLNEVDAGRPENVEEPTLLANGGDGSDPIFSDYQGIEEPIEVDGETKFKRTGLRGFDAVDDISIVCVPDEHRIGQNLTDAIVDHCELLEDRFAIIQANQSNTNLGELYPSRNSQYAAFYNPWIRVYDPLTNTNKLIPPGAHVAGIYARSDTERGVHKAPANEVVRGVSELQFEISKGEQGTLNPRGVNCIRAFRGRGIRVWGARTTASDPLWKYVNVRRLFIYLEESVDEATQWVVFEPNIPQLWARVRATLTVFLTRVWKDGALFGNTAEEAFFVKCDRTTMTDDDINNGRLICVIGVAPSRPAEFVIFRFAQLTASANAAA